MTDLATIVALSHEYGTSDFVKGGGGNTSTKDANTLWVKPSGTTLSGLSETSFVAMDRRRIDALYLADTPDEPTAREALVKDLMAAAVCNAAGRPSVEAPLHNVFDARFVVHTHPALVNGMTCARDGENVCHRLFPEALWVEYIDPGYTLCMVVRERIRRHQAEHGAQPALLVLQNHGIFIAADSPEDVRGHYRHVRATLERVYRHAGVDMSIRVPDAPPSPDDEQAIRTLLANDAAHIASIGRFRYAAGPVSPDHLVYARAFPYTDALTAAGIQHYREQRGYAPKVIATDTHVYGVGTTASNASLALELAQDGALVMQLANAFGGIQYMTDAQREFIENWEVESYRQKQV